MKIERTWLIYSTDSPTLLIVHPSQLVRHAWSLCLKSKGQDDEEQWITWVVIDLLFVKYTDTTVAVEALPSSVIENDVAVAQKMTPL